MSGNSKAKRSRYRHDSTTIHVAPITRAVRAALAASAIALAGGGAAMAADCADPQGAHLIHCARENVEAEQPPVVDLTRVADGSTPTSVIPVTGVEALPRLSHPTSTADITTLRNDPAQEADFSVRIVNRGTISKSGSGDVIGIDADFAGTDLTVINRGSISATSADGLADGIFAHGATVEVTNAGGIEADGYTWAAGIEAQGEDATMVANTVSGIIIATAAAYDSESGMYGHAYGIYVAGAGGEGGVTVNNRGSIDATGPYATGIYAYDGGSGGITISNRGDITATADNGYAAGIKAAANVEGSDISVVNRGSIDAAGMNGATGIAAAVTGTGSSASVNNRGDIRAATTEYYSFAEGLVALADDDARIRNSGTLTVDGGYLVYGALALAFAGDADMQNTGDIAVNGGYDVYGVLAVSRNGDVGVSNSGAITVAGEDFHKYADAVGIHASSPTETTVTNASTGTIAVSGENRPAAIMAAGDVAIVNNAGAIEAGGPDASGIVAAGGALARVRNTGRVGVRADYYGVAINVEVNGAEGIARVTNAGDLVATSSDGYGHGSAVGIRVTNVHRAEIGNTGNIELRGDSYSTGIGASGDELVIGNAGTIASTTPDIQQHYGSFTGLRARAAGDGGSTIEINTAVGSSITGNGLPYATGIAVTGGREVRIDNAGDITLVDDFDTSQTYGWFGGAGVGVQASSSVDAVRIDVVNSGDITTDLTLGGASGIGAAALGGAGSNIDIGNDGNIDVYSAGFFGGLSVYSAAGMWARSEGGANVVNDGDIAVGIGYGNVKGIDVETGAGDATVRNSGTIAVTAIASGYYGNPDNIGIRVISPDAGIQIDNAGQIAVTASYANAIGIHAHGDEAVVTNSGSITIAALSSAAIGIATQGGALTVVNHGDIQATTGTADPYNAIGVQMDATTSATFNNTGAIRTATSEGTGVAVLIDSDGTLDFTNTGILEGAVITHAGDDNFTGAPGSAWKIANQSTDLGAGADRIHNAADAVIELVNGGIELGSGRNDFRNDGLIVVRGDSLIDMGRDADASDAGSRARLRFGGVGMGARPARAVMPLLNNGVIDLAGASPDDRLTIAGDLGGRGVIRLGLYGSGVSADRLVVDGSVRPGSVQTVNVRFAGFDAIRKGGRTDFAFVQNDSTAGSFVGGDVLGFEPGNFLRLGVDVSSRIDAGNQRDDVFSARVQAQGLDDSGKLAASVGAVTQRLLASQIGTWRQRSGVVSGQSPDSTVIGFVRSFRDEGVISPMYAGNAGRHSNFAFGQRNAGAELGMNYQPAPGFSLGMRLGKSEGQQTLTGAGHGLNWMQADTFGVYGTWFSPLGFYVDTSVWRMDFDSRMQSSGSRHAVRGDASAASVETGYAFKSSSGLRVEPSLQYTWGRVDGLSLRGSQAEFRSEAYDWHHARVGLLAWKPIRGGSGIAWTPYGSASVVRMDGSGSDYTVSDVFDGSTSVAGMSTLLELGLGLHRRGFSANVGVNWTSGSKAGDFLGGQVLLRYGW